MKRIKTLGEFLRSVEIWGTPIKVWGDDTEMPLWEGRAHDCPYWVADLKLDYSFTHPPIEYRDHMGDDGDEDPGFSIVVCE